MPKGNSTLAERWIGRRFGRLVVVEAFPEGKALVKCDCGNVYKVHRSNLLNGSTRSCGCLLSKTISDNTESRWIGKRFSRLVVIKTMKGRGAIVQCDCGTVLTVLRDNLKRLITKSCGCLAIEIRTKHGHAKSGTKSSEYGIWKSMLNRCNSEGCAGYQDYGGRGIKVCDRWLKFENFLSDMGPRPEGRSIDRIDNNKGYSPDNCRWATAIEQASNKRIHKTAVLLSYGGVVRYLADWSKLTGIKQNTLKNRLNLGWTVDEAITTPIGEKPKRK